MFTPNCKAMVLGDQYVCDRCQVCWDLDDDPAVCEPDGVMEEFVTPDDAFEILKGILK